MFNLFKPKCNHEYHRECTYAQSVFEQEYSAEGGGICYDKYKGLQDIDVYRCVKCLDKKLFYHQIRE